MEQTVPPTVASIRLLTQFTNGNPNTTIAAQSPATVIGNQPSQQGQMILATYIGGVWYLN